MPTVIRLRPVMVPWTCHRSGDCCRSLPAVVMTEAERDLILERRPDLALHYTPGPKSGFVALAARPCPLLATAPDGKAECTVWDIRPYNCRRFACGRVSLTEPYEQNARGQCVNVTERIEQSKPFRKFAERLQRHAQQWADAHGWRPAE